MITLHAKNIFRVLFFLFELFTLSHNYDVSKSICFSVLIWCFWGEGNGIPCQYSCLENPVARGTCWTTVHGVSQSRTRLKRLSMHACIGIGNGNPLQYSCLENPRTEGPGGLPSMGRTESDMTEVT